MAKPATPKIVTRDEWERARAELLVRESRFRLAIAAAKCQS